MNGQTLFKSRRVPAAVFGFLLCLSMSGCDSKYERQIINQLQNELKVGQIIPLSSVLNIADGDVCLLYPYQDDVAREAPQSTRINAYLEASDYKGGEGHWAFVVAEPEKMQLLKFRLSRKLDVTSYAIQQKNKTQLPPGFVPVNYASLAQAVLTKIELHSEIYLIMGEMK